MLISFEGLPGAGKTTQSRLLAHHLTSEGTTACLLSDLATLHTDPLGDLLYDLFASSGDPFMRHRDVVTEAHLAAAIRTNLVAARIEPALQAHDVVIEDRGLDTMFSYALAGLPPDETSAGMDWLDALGRLTGRSADLALWLRLPPQDAIHRATLRDGRAYSLEQQTYLTRVDVAYATLAARHPVLIRIDVPTTATTQAVQHMIQRAISAHLPAGRSDHA